MKFHTEEAMGFALQAWCLDAQEGGLRRRNWRYYTDDGMRARADGTPHAGKCWRTTVEMDTFPAPISLAYSVDVVADLRAEPGTTPDPDARRVIQRFVVLQNQPGIVNQAHVNAAAENILAMHDAFISTMFSVRARATIAYSHRVQPFRFRVDGRLSVDLPTGGKLHKGAPEPWSMLTCTYFAPVDLLVPDAWLTPPDDAPVTAENGP